MRITRQTGNNKTQETITNESITWQEILVVCYGAFISFFAEKCAMSVPQIMN